MKIARSLKEDYSVIVIDNSDIAKPASRKMPIPVYEKVFSAAENGFVSETYENLCCLESLSKNFSKKCVRTLDRGFDANDYYRYFLKCSERFVIRAKELTLIAVYGFGAEPMLLLSNRILKMGKVKISAGLK